jgi:Leucine-rich repeat (LRR) protein/uncharacterized protein YwqG
MALYSEEELKQLPEFGGLEEALRNPAQVFRLRIGRGETPAALVRIAELTNLQSLYIAGADVSQFLPRLGELKDLQNFALQACRFSGFPEGVFQLSNLRSLSIGNSSLEQLPEEIGQLSKLEDLYLSQNELARLPEGVCQLPRLKKLGLYFNQIEELPEAIGDLQELIWLTLSANRITVLPESIGKLRRLESLSLDGNDLRTLPESICQLGALEDLSLDGNPFESLPACLSTMTWIKDLTIEAEKRPLFMDWSYRPSEKPPRVELADLKLFVEADSPLYASLVSAVEENGLDSIRPEIWRSAREAVQIESTEPDDYSRPGNSRLGGFPDLADAALFPRSDDGRYWIFLAQMNLAEVAPLNGYLPRTGLLSFFIDSTESLHARVLFYEGNPGALTTIRHGGGDELTDADDDYTESPHRVKFRRFFSLPHNPPAEIEDDDEKADAYEKCRKSAGSGDHHLNGYTFTQHESPEQMAANEIGGKPEEWVPLIQLGWDNKTGFCFWDAGTLTFTIHQEDLRRWDFSRMRVSLETS